MKKKSKWEEMFAVQCRGLKIQVEREFKFHPVRRWRADFSIPSLRILIEIDGGVWGGRHTTGTGFSADCEKMSHAALLGYRVFRFTPEMVKSGEGIGMIEQVLRDCTKYNKEK